LIRNVAESFAERGTLFSPVGGNINGIGGHGIKAFDRSAAVSDGIGFKETGAGFIPLVGFDGDVVFEKKTWFCG